MTTKLVKCSCAHDQQDEMYGKGQRLANITGKGQHRCTVCGQVHGTPGAVKEMKKK